MNRNAIINRLAADTRAILLPPLQWIKRKALYVVGLVAIRYRHRRVRGASKLHAGLMAIIDTNDLVWHQIVYGSLK